MISKRSICATQLVASQAACSAPDEEGWEEGATELPGSAEQALVGSCQSNALQRVSATASSVENASLGAALAIDGNPTTRWSSAFSDPQWLRVDLGAVRLINRVKLSWEAASSKAFSVQVSDDDVTWRTVYSTTTGPSGPSTLEIPSLEARARFVRVYATQRTTPWGNSLYELEVFGDANPGCGTPSDASYDIQSVHSGRSIDVKDFSLADGAAIQQWGYGGGFNQRWVPVPQGNGEYLLKSTLHSGKCLDVDGWSTANGANIIQWPCHGGANQRFRLNHAGNGQFSVVSVHSGKCLDVAGWSTADGARILQWDCHGGNNQKWRFNRVSGTRKWATRDANASGSWNWSVTSSSGGSTASADTLGDLYASGNTVSFGFSHNGTGYAEASLTTGYSTEGVEPTSIVERDAGKAVNPRGRLSFTYGGYTSREPNRINLSRLKLVDTHGNSSNSVRVIDYLNHCAQNSCDVDIPLSALANSAFDFSSVRSITAFVDSSVAGSNDPTVASGYYFFSMGNAEFVPDGEAIDLASDPDNCGSAGHSCLGGACRDGFCQAAQLGDELFCSGTNAMTVGNGKVYVGDSSTSGASSITRYDLNGSNKTVVASGIEYPHDFFYRDGTLYFGTFPGVMAKPDTGAAVKLTNTDSTLVGVTSTSLLSYRYDYDAATSTTSSRYFKLDRFTPNVSSVLKDLNGAYPNYTATTSSALYYVHTQQDGTAELVRVSLSDGTSTAVSFSSGYVGNLSASSSAVYFTFSDYNATTPTTTIRRWQGGAVETLLTVTQPSSVTSVWVDETDPAAPQLYYSLWDNSTQALYRSPASDTSRRTVVSTSRYPYQSTRVFFTADSMIWHEPCYKYTGGSVHRLRKN
jgi:hypothetical protein